MSGVRSDRFWNTQGVLTKTVKRKSLGPEIVVGCHRMSEKTEVSDCTGSTVHIICKTLSAGNVQFKTLECLERC